MLRIYPVILDWHQALRPTIESIRKSDQNLAYQLQRSSVSVALNTAEGMSNNGRRKLAAYRIALGEMRESMAAIDIATRLTYIKAIDDNAYDRQQKIFATLTNLAMPWQK